ncbi:DUF58 domain-containing protein [Georgenia sp. SYP-B2076]|uniref:DUF58 domain-containing protein n=1 Tax=Georgenia sp. SYP-B2076 TaxID=2495881 RepID=UPI000F8D11A2|nr:DUF58 domain-containing protein [Georgenia sp. SYP-B2076]
MTARGPTPPGPTPPGATPPGATVRGLTARGWAFLGAGVTIVVGAALLGFPDLTRIGVLLAVLPLLALASVWRRTPQIAARRLAPAVLRPGESAQVRVELRNEGRRGTLPHLAREHVDPQLGHGPHVVLPRLAPGEREDLTYTIRGAARGRYVLGPVALGLQDPFGLTLSRGALRETAEVLVLPRVEPLGGGGHRWHGGAGERPMPHMVASQGEDDLSTRFYRQGDDLRRIHWPATAHRAELMVRQEERPARRRAVLVLGPRPADPPAGGGPSFEWAVSALASVAVYLAGQGYAVHLVSAETVREGRAARALGVDAVLRCLAVAAPDAGDVEPVLRAARAITAGVLVAAVTADDGPAVRRLTRARAPGTIGVLLLDGASGAPGGQAPVPGPAGANGVADLVRAARAAGWRAAVVRPGAGVAETWDRVTATGPRPVPA